jgi:integrase
MAEVTPTEISRLINGVTAQVSAATADAVYRTCSALFNAAGEVPRIPPLDDREHDAEPFRTYWLIQTSTGRPVNYSAYDKALVKACASADVPRVSSHSLRHTYVSRMIDEGHSADKVAFWIGDTPDTVRSVYAHMLEESSAPAAASIDEALSGIS